MEGDDKSCFTRLFEAGIIVQDADSLVKFTSPWAVRYYFQYLFPIRGYPNPSSLAELVRKAIGSMSAKVLKGSIIDENGFPQQATLQHQFMKGLARWTAPTCSICPELSDVFPLSTHERSQRNGGAIDFYLDLGEKLQWRIELLAHGDENGEEIPKGRYAVLPATDHVVVEFLGNQNGEITNVKRMAKRVTVLFTLGDFSSCRCIFGFDKGAKRIRLKN